MQHVAALYLAAGGKVGFHFTSKWGIFLIGFLLGFIAAFVIEHRK